MYTAPCCPSDMGFLTKQLPSAFLLVIHQVTRIDWIAYGTSNPYE